MIHNRFHFIIYEEAVSVWEALSQELSVFVSIGLSNFTGLFLFLFCSMFFPLTIALLVAMLCLSPTLVAGYLIFRHLLPAGFLVSNKFVSYVRTLVFSRKYLPKERHVRIF
jgi:hypothetical protein